jgi:IS30 family transposase
MESRSRSVLDALSSQNKCNTCYGVVAMGQCYSQLSLEERIEIYRLHAAGESMQEIARSLERHVSTISREIHRNGLATKVWPGGYAPARAQKLAERRRRWDGRFKLARQPDLQDLVKDRLAMGHSPEQIAGRLTLEHGHTVISHESIYRFAYHRSAQKDYWHRLLPRRKSRRGRLGKRGGSAASAIKFRRSISERAVNVTDRATPGHWEADFMLFAKYGQGLLVAHERQSRYTILDHPPDRKAERTARRLARMLEPLPPPLRKTLTIDNGTEFALHYRLTEQLALQTYFCDPHSPWQKGGVENAIGRLRRRLPRKTNLAALSSRQLARIVRIYNETPRKCLDFKTPAEAFSLLKSTVALQP